LLDAAHLMEEEKVAKPLYTVEDVESVYDLPSTYVSYNEEIRLRKNATAIFRDTGHILDSATIQIDYIEKGQPKTIVFSGDLGNHNDMVMPDPVPVKRADTFYIELLTNIQYFQILLQFRYLKFHNITKRISNGRIFQKSDGLGT